MTASRFLIAGSVAALLQIGVAVAQSPQPEQGGQPTQPTHPAMPQTPDQSPQQTPPPEQGGQPSQPTHPAVQGEEKGTSFESLDKDSDGRISKTEAEANAKVSQQFAMYDKNGNGFIEKDEVTSANTAPPESPKQ
ncbi:MAG TPA: hypothetical protein VFO82_01755 [Steroidobacteraceae bacterium]|nr:hypothetical protein [Steroidobacteraceae bacterium]